MNPNKEDDVIQKKTAQLLNMHTLTHQCFFFDTTNFYFDE